MSPAMKSAMLLWRRNRAIPLRFRKLRLYPAHPAPWATPCRLRKCNHYLMSQEELENKIATLTGGRAAEELVFHSASTGASNDIEPGNETCPFHDYPGTV